MKTIRQNVEVNFHHVELEDAIVMEPLMASLAQAVEHNKAIQLYDMLPKEERDNYSLIFSDDVRIDCNSAQQIYDILTKHGYRTVSKILNAFDILDKHKR